MSVIKVGLITTINTNIGDDFIRDGICRVLTEVFRGNRLEFVSINKHNPYTVYPSWHPLHPRHYSKQHPIIMKYIRNTVSSLITQFGFSRFDDCDLIVQCGAPVFWPGCSHSEWAKPLWHDVVGRLCRKTPILNLAAGSCFPWERQPDSMELADDAKYIKSILGYCCLTTVRDCLAERVCSSVGEEAPLIPCSAFLAARGRNAVLEDSGYILINYMDGGGHFAWEQEIDASQWEDVIKNTINALGKRHKLAFLCHDDKERSLSRRIDSNLPVFYPKTPSEYFNCIRNAKFGICNRMHASVGMAGMGVPSIAVCTDTRMLMVAELGLPVHYVKDVDAVTLEEETEVSLRSLKAEKERLVALQEKTWDMYLVAIRNVLS